MKLGPDSIHLEKFLQDTEHAFKQLSLSVREEKINRLKDRHYIEEYPTISGHIIVRTRSHRQKLYLTLLTANVKLEELKAYKFSKE